MRWLFGKLCKSHSVQETSSDPISTTHAGYPPSRGAEEPPATRKRSLLSLGLRKGKSAGSAGLTASSTWVDGTANGGPLGKTFDYNRPGYRLPTYGWGSTGRGAQSDVGAVPSCCGEESRFDPELDKSMMQTINDVKYENRRPKFTAVGEWGGWGVDF